MSPWPRAGARAMSSRVATVMHGADGMTTTRAPAAPPRAVERSTRTLAPARRSASRHAATIESSRAGEPWYCAAASSRTTTTLIGSGSRADASSDPIGMIVRDPGNRATGGGAGEFARTVSATDAPMIAAAVSATTSVRGRSLFTRRDRVRWTGGRSAVLGHVLVERHAVEERLDGAAIRFVGRAPSLAQLVPDVASDRHDDRHEEGDENDVGEQGIDAHRRSDPPRSGELSPRHRHARELLDRREQLRDVDHRDEEEAVDHRVRQQ